MMPSKTTDSQTEDILLTQEDCQKNQPGFIRMTLKHLVQGQFAKALASGFIKFTPQGQQLSELDSVHSFIALSDLHRLLTQEAQSFLREDVPFVYENQPIHPLLLNFALFRLKAVSREFYFATLQNQPTDQLDALKAEIQARQKTYEAILEQA